MNSKHSTYLAILIFGLVVGLAIGGDFGRSVDELVHRRYAEQTIEIYRGLRDPSDTIENLRYYGPVYNVITLVVSRLAELWPGWDRADGRHLSYYLAFLLSVIAFHWLAKRYLSNWSAVVVTLLFATQPLLFGHAFINPKDIPFMAFFMTSVVLGFVSADKFANHGNTTSENSRDSATRGDRHLPMNQTGETQSSLRSPRKQAFLVGVVGLAVTATADVAVLRLLQAGAYSLLEGAYDQHSPKLINAIFAFLAEDAWKTPLEAYSSKLSSLVWWTETTAAALLWIASAVLAARLFIWDPAHRRTAASRWIWLAIAGVCAGFTITIRVGGLLACLLICFVIVERLKARAAGPLLVYIGVAALVTFAAWPYLWSDPLRRLVNVVLIMARFHHPAQILYLGELHSTGELPWHFLFLLTGVQMSEPAVVLFFLGLGLLAWSRFRLIRMPEAALLLAWLILPPTAAVLLDSTVYDNTRQFLFALPPMFLVAGIAIDAGLRMPMIGKARTLLAVGILLPGVLGVIRLHPYEYVYYNAFVGGTVGASRQFELDYWCISYREAMEFINEVAPYGAKVGVHEFAHVASPYARKDLVIDLITSDADVRQSQPDFLIVSSIADSGRRMFLDWADLFRVERDAGSLSIVKIVGEP